MLDRRLVIFGGSHGSKYLGDMYVLDTDPVPEPLVNAPSCLQLVCSDLRQYFDREDFSDVTLFVEGKAVLAHRLVLSIASDRYVYICCDIILRVYVCVCVWYTYVRFMISFTQFVHSQITHHTNTHTLTHTTLSQIPRHVLLRIPRVVRA